MKKKTLTDTTLVFVYNSDSGLFSTVADMARKAFSPKTYRCKLCALTHSTFAMRKSWQEFLASLEMPLEFLHADELQNLYFITGTRLPAVFSKKDGILTLLIAADVINECVTMEDLKLLVRRNLS